MTLTSKFLVISILAFSIISCSDSNNNRTHDEFGVPYPDLVLESFEDRISYAIGADMGANFNNMPEEMFSFMDTEALENGFYEGMTGVKGERDDCQSVLQAAFSSPEGIDTSMHDMTVVSDCYGFIFGEMMKKNLDAKEAFNEINPEITRKGFAHALYEVDTLIPIEERSKMVADFNNDMAKIAGEKMIDEAANIEGAYVSDEGWILVEKEKGTLEPINKNKEYKIIYSMRGPGGDTIISTIIDKRMSDEENAQVINTDDIVIPDGWSMASSMMTVGGEYELYLPYDLAYGERGLMNQNQSGYIIQPYTSVIISTKVIEQARMHSFAKKRGEKVIAEAKKQPNTKVGPSGYVLETIEEGDGQKVKAGSDVKAHYILRNSKGEVIENSYMGAQQGRGAPTFSLNSVIKGWQDAVPEMRKGGRYKLYLPHDIAYGESGNQGIAPFETLTFEMEIIDFGKPGSLTQQQQQQQMPQGM